MSSSSQMPKCDICLETVGYFFCVEDRALLCRNCDVAIHTANSYVSGHQRFLLTGVKVGLESTEPLGSSTAKKNSNSVERSATASRSVSRRLSSTSSIGETNEALSGLVGGVGGPIATKLSLAGSATTESNPELPFDEYLGLIDFNQNYAFVEDGSPKADSDKLGDVELSAILQDTDKDTNVDECLGRVPEIPCMVQQVPSPPTASGLYWLKNSGVPPSDGVVFVPDISCPSVHNLHRVQPDGNMLKRQRQ